jgi:hypothetical protein
MSSAANWSYSATATVWPRIAREDWGGVESFGTPYTIACDYSAKADRLTDARGVEFVPRLVLFTEAAAVQQGDRVLLGTSVAPDPIAAGAVEVRVVDRFADTLERVADDYRIAA